MRWRKLRNRAPLQRTSGSHSMSGRAGLVARQYSSLNTAPPAHSSGCRGMQPDKHRALLLQCFAGDQQATCGVEMMYELVET
jgi:hypothetical protein